MRVLCSVKFLICGVFVVSHLFSKVTFLGYFAGCVDHNNMSVVSGDGKDEDLGWRVLYRPGPEPVRARVLLVDYVNKVQKRYPSLSNRVLL